MSQPNNPGSLLRSGDRPLRQPRPERVHGRRPEPEPLRRQQPDQCRRSQWDERKEQGRGLGCSTIYVLTVPKERIERDGLPPAEMKPTIYNLTADRDLLKQMGITEEWVELPEGIDAVGQLLEKGNSVVPLDPNEDE